MKRNLSKFTPKKHDLDWKDIYENNSFTAPLEIYRGEINTNSIKSLRISSSVSSISTRVLLIKETKRFGVT